MRSIEQRKKCKKGHGESGHEGPFTRLNDSFSRCESCGGIIGNELVR